MNSAKTHNIDGTSQSNDFNATDQAGLGQAKSQAVLKTIFARVMDAGSSYLAGTNNIALGGVRIKFYQVDFTLLPQPLKRKLVQLKSSDIDLPAAKEIPGLYQFVGNLEDQYLYLLEHPENIFLAHMGRIIAYSKR